MEHFAAIQSLCRVGLEADNPQFRQQVERLRDRLKKDQNTKEADVLDRLLNSKTHSAELKPSRVELSRALVVGETLTANVHPPVDKETSAPLAEIILKPTVGKITPIFTPDLNASIQGVLNEWRQFEKLKDMGVEPSRSCLLFGQPGTGKTLTAYYIAEQLGLPLVSAKLDGLVSSYLGTTARNIANLFEFANRYQCVLLLDEFDAVAKMRDDPQEVGEIKRVVNTLLQNLDQRSGIGITIAITNHELLLDPAIWRRFEVRIEMPMPAFDERKALIDQLIGALSQEDGMSDFLAWITDGYTGSDIRTLLNFLKRTTALSEVGVLDILPMLNLYSHTNATSTKKGYLHLSADPKRIVKELRVFEDAKFTQIKMGQILNKDQGTISRWLKEISEEA